MPSCLILPLVLFECWLNLRLWLGRKEKGILAPVLQEMDVVIWSNSRCKLEDGYDRFVSRSIICVKQKQGRKTATAEGDSGGPLTVQVDINVRVN